MHLGALNRHIHKEEIFPYIFKMNSINLFIFYTYELLLYAKYSGSFQIVRKESSEGDKIYLDKSST